MARLFNRSFSQYIFVMTAFFSAYLCYFPAGENVQIAGDIAGCRRLLTTLDMH